MKTKSARIHHMYQRWQHRQPQHCWLQWLETDWLTGTSLSVLSDPLPGAVSATGSHQYFRLAHTHTASLTTDINWLITGFLWWLHLVKYVTQRSGVRPSHRRTHCHSPGGSMRHKHTFWPYNNEDRHTFQYGKVICFSTVLFRYGAHLLLQAGVQPTLDPSAETFISVQCASLGRGGDLVGVCSVCVHRAGWRKA